MREMEEKDGTFLEWMENDLGINSLSQLVTMNIPWYKCSHPIHDPYRSIAIKAHLLTPTIGDGEFTIDVNPNIVTVVDPKENSGTEGVFTSLSRSYQKSKLLLREPRDILQIGSINYYSTLSLDRELRNLGIPSSNLFIIDICPSIPMHLQFLTSGNKRTFYNKINPLIADAQKLPFPGASFDIVYEDMVGPYLEDPTSMYREVIRVLRPGGLFITRERHYDNHYKFISGQNLLSLVEPLTDFLIELFPEESQLREALETSIRKHFTEEWAFSAYWERPIGRYLEALNKSGFLLYRPCIITRHSLSGNVRESLVCLCHK